METAVFPVQSGLQRPSSLYPEDELSGAGVSIEAWWQPFSPFSPECNDLRHCIQKVNSRGQSSLSKRGDSRFPRSVCLATTYVTASRRWNLEIRRLSQSEVTAIFSRSVRSATTFVTASRRWTLEIRCLSRSDVTAVFSGKSGVQRPSSMHPEGELLGSGVSRRWTLKIRRLSRIVVTAVFPVQSGVQRPSSLHPEGELSESGVSLEAWWQPCSPFSPESNDLQDQASPEGELSESGVSLEAMWLPFFPVSPECNDLCHCILKVNSRSQSSLSKRGDSRFPRSVRLSTTYVTASRRWILEIRSLSRSEVTAIFSRSLRSAMTFVTASKRWTLEIRRLSRSEVTAIFFPFNPECNDLRYCIQKVNSRDQASLSKRGDSRFPRSVWSATTFVTTSRRWTLEIRRLSRSVVKAIFPFSPESNDNRHCIHKVNSRNQASLSKRCDCRFPVQYWVQRPSSLHPEGELSGSGVSLEAMWLPFSRSVRLATTFVTASRRWTLGIRRLSRSEVTAIFSRSVRSAMTFFTASRRWTLEIRRLSRSEVTAIFSRSVRSAMTFVTASRRWTLGIRRLSRSDVTAVFPVQSGVQRPSSLHPEGELSRSGVPLEETWLPFFPVSPECNDLHHCILKVNSRSQSSLSKRGDSRFSGQSGVQRPSSMHPEGELLGSGVSLEAWWQPFSPFSPEFNDLRQCIQKVNSRDQASLSKRCDCRFPRSVRSATTYVTASRRWTLGIRRLSRSVVTAVFPVQSGVQRPSSLHPEGELLGSGVSRRWTLKIRRLSRIVVTAVFPVQSGVQRPSSMHPEGEL